MVSNKLRKGGPIAKKRHITIRGQGVVMKDRLR